MIAKYTIENNKNLILEESKFVEHKLLTSDVLLKLKEAGFTKQYNDSLRCGNYLLFSLQEHLVTQEQRKRLKDARFCKFRFCPMCSWRRSRNIGIELLKAFETIEKQKKVSYIFLTLTIKNPPVNELKQSVKHMNEAFRRLSQTKSYKKAVLGHFKALEILGDKTVEREAHPHFHCLLIVDKKYFKSRYYIKQEQWQKMWKKALRVDYEPSVDIRRIKPKKNSKLTELQSAVYEVAKYSVKHTDLVSKSVDDFKELVNQTYNMRFFSTGGILKKVNLKKIEEDLVGNENSVEWYEIMELFYKWENGNYVLKKEILSLDIKGKKSLELKNNLDNLLKNSGTELVKT